MDLFAKNLDLVFFIYGLSFFIMGIAVFVQPRKESIFRLANILWLLGVFGISHGINEWLDMFQIIKGYHWPIWDSCRVMVLTLSYIFFFEFGRRLIVLSFKRFFNKWLTIALSILVFILIFTSKYELSIWPRYFLGFPGGLLTAVGFALYYRQNKDMLRPFDIGGYFLIAIFSIGIYSILGGLVTPKENFFPASIINTTSFFNMFGIPVQVFRTLCAVLSAWAVWNILDIFNWETIYKLESSLEEVTVTKTFADNIINSMADALVVVDSDTKIREINKAAAQLLGYDREELLDKPAKELFEAGAPFEGAKLRKLIEDGYLKNYELTCLSKDKTEIPVLFSASVMRNPRGEIIGIVSVLKDLREFKSLQQRLAYSEKFALMGKVAGIIGHEFRNQLAVMRNTVYFLKMKLQDADEKIKEHLGILDGQITETNSIIENILTFAATRQPDLKEIDLKELLSVSIDKAQLSQGIEMVKEIDEDLPKIPADAIQLSRVFINIILNAAQAMEGSGKITVKAYRTDSYMNILFKDTGPGMKEEIKQKIFEPFFSTKEHGIGLGLVTANAIVEAHNGKIDIKSEAGKGTAVIIRLPVKV